MSIPHFFIARPRFAVVISIVLILILDYFLTRLLLHFN